MAKRLHPLVRRALLERGRLGAAVDKLVSFSEDDLQNSGFPNYYPASYFRALRDWRDSLNASNTAEAALKERFPETWCQLLQESV